MKVFRIRQSIRYIFEISGFHWSKRNVECAIYSILISNSAQARGGSSVSSDKKPIVFDFALPEGQIKESWNQNSALIFESNSWSSWLQLMVWNSLWSRSTSINILMLHKVQPHTAWTVNLKLNICIVYTYIFYIYRKKGVNNTKFNINLTVWCCWSFSI